MSVHQAIEELNQAKEHAERTRIPSVKLPPLWPKVHALEEQKRQRFLQQQQAKRAKKKAGFVTSQSCSDLALPKRLTFAERSNSMGDLGTASFSSSAASMCSTMRGELRKSSNLLNSPQTHKFPTQPLKASLKGNRFSDVGSLSMVGTQVCEQTY